MHWTTKCIVCQIKGANYFGLKYTLACKCDVFYYSIPVWRKWTEYFDEKVCCSRWLDLKQVRFCLLALAIAVNEMNVENWHRKESREREKEWQRRKEVSGKLHEKEKEFTICVHIFSQIAIVSRNCALHSLCKLRHLFVSWCS